MNEWPETDSNLLMCYRDRVNTTEMSVLCSYVGLIVDLLVKNSVGAEKQVLR
jgi:hypothetical protein